MQSLDSKINWVYFYSNYLKDLKRIGQNKMITKCPFHDDTHASFWFNTTNGCFKCEACGTAGNGQTFLEKIENIDNKEAYKRLLKLSGEYKEPEKSEKFNLQFYSEYKGLSLDFLKTLQLENSKSGIAIPYFDINGNLIYKRARYGKRMFSWPKGAKVNLYGLWKINDFKKLGFIVLVEGESDAQTLWYHNIPAIGVPGASTFQQKWVEYIKDLNVYIHKEPDIGGETFIKKTCEALSKASFIRDVFEISIQGFKDPSELHLNSGDDFDTKWKVVMGSARKLDIKNLATKIEEIIPGAPVQPRIPPSFKLSEEGIFVLNEKNGAFSRFCSTPILISRRLVSLETNEEKLEIAFLKDHKWHRQIVQRSTIFQNRSIIQLSDIGINVTSENSKVLVKFLGELLDENMELIEISRSVSQMGWHGEKFLPYLSEDLVLDIDSSGQRWQSSYHEKGSFEKWKEGMKPYRDNYIFRFILSSSFAAPLLKILNHRIFMVHNWGDSRSGKTAALKAALSVWGEPEGLMGNFNATRVGLERMASFFTDLPLCIDEKQVVGNKQDFIESLVYMLSIGKSKVRGTKSGGMQNSFSWRSIILTTGEEPIIVSNSQGGINTRVLEIYGSPFNDETSARNMHDLSQKDYGHAGATFLKHFLEGKKHSELRTLYVDLLKVYEKEINIGTHIQNVALVAACDVLVSEIVFDEKKEEAFKKALNMGSKLLFEISVQEEDVNDKAYDYIKEWAISNRNQFDIDAKQRYGYIEGRTFYILPSVLEEALSKRNYSMRKTMRALADKKVIGVSYENNKTRYSVTKRFNGTVTRVIEIRFKDMEESEPF